MRTLYIVGGAMGVGKTTTCRLLCERLENSALLDGDWLWALHPFRVTDVTKRLVCDNIVAVLNNFLACSELENIVSAGCCIGRTYPRAAFPACTRRAGTSAASR